MKNVRIHRWVTSNRIFCATEVRKVCAVHICRACAAYKMTLWYGCTNFLSSRKLLENAQGESGETRGDTFIIHNYHLTCPSSHVTDSVMICTRSSWWSLHLDLCTSSTVFWDKNAVRSRVCTCCDDAGCIICRFLVVSELVLALLHWWDFLFSAAVRVLNNV